MWPFLFSIREGCRHVQKIHIINTRIFLHSMFTAHSPQKQHGTERHNTDATDARAGALNLNGASLVFE
jgi:hypothetical protein